MTRAAIVLLLAAWSAWFGATYSVTLDWPRLFVAILSGLLCISVAVSR